MQRMRAAQAGEHRPPGSPRSRMVGATAIAVIGLAWGLSLVSAEQEPLAPTAGIAWAANEAPAAPPYEAAVEATAAVLIASTETEAAALRDSIDGSNFIRAALGLSPLSGMVVVADSAAAEVLTGFIVEGNILLSGSHRPEVAVARISQ